MSYSPASAERNRRVFRNFAGAYMVRRSVNK